MRVTDPGHVPDRQSGDWREHRQAGQKGYPVPKHRRKMSWDDVEKLVRLLVSAIAPVADLIRAIARLR
jgi:hypothetical protein